MDTWLTKPSCKKFRVHFLPSFLISIKFPSLPSLFDDSSKLVSTLSSIPLWFSAGSIDKLYSKLLTDPGVCEEVPTVRRNHFPLEDGSVIEATYLSFKAQCSGFTVEDCRL